MARRAPITGSLARVATSLDAAARSAARERARSVRSKSEQAGREARALARMRAQKEREEARAEARAEHEDNERFERELRTLIAKAPPIRDRSAHEAEARPRPFDEDARAKADDAVAASRAHEAAERVPAPVFHLFVVYAIAAILSLLLLSGGVFLMATAPLAGLVLIGLAVLGAAAGYVIAPRAARTRHEELKADVRERARVKYTAELKAKREEARAAHAKDEEARVAAKKRLLAGDLAETKAQVEAALARLELPVESSSAIEPLGPAVLELEVNLPSIDDGAPTQRSTLLKDGRISYRDRAKKDVQELYARVVCGLVLLHGAVALDAAPALEVVLVSGFVPGADPRTGEAREDCLVSVAVEREALARLKLDRADPIAALENFERRFKATAQWILKPVEPLAPRDLDEPKEAVEDAPAPARTASGKERRAAAKPPEPTAPPEPVQGLAEDALRLAIACARADGKVEPEELAAVAKVIERLAPTGPARKRLEGLRASLLSDRIDAPAAARRIRERVAADERRTLGEELVAVALADGKVDEAERALVEKLLAELDLPVALLQDALVAMTTAADAEARARREHLAALELPPDADPDGPELDRALASVRARYAPEKLADLADEIRSLGARKRERAEAAHTALVGALPPERRQAREGPPPVGTPIRKNDDLDAIFG
jgi:tellurite resistance protein